MAWNYRILPDAYQQVEYIQTDGSAYIDTGFQPYYADNNTRIMGVFSLPEKTPGSLIGASGKNKKYFYIPNPDYRNDLPSEYQQVEYLESSSTQFINTGYKPGNLTRICMECEFPYANANTSQILFGARTDQKEKSFTLTLVSSHYRYCYNTVEVNFASYFSDKISIDLDKGSLTIIGSEDQYTSTKTATFTTVYNLYLFGLNNKNTFKYGAYARIYNCQIFDNDVLIKDYIPCYRKSDDVPGLYDTVSGEFLINSGTGEFNIGNNVNEEILDDPNTYEDAAIGFGINNDHRYEASYSEQQKTFEMSNDKWIEDFDIDYMQLTEPDSDPFVNNTNVKLSYAKENGYITISGRHKTSSSYSGNYSYKISNFSIDPGKYYFWGSNQSAVKFKLFDSNNVLIGIDSGDGVTFDILETTTISIYIVITVSLIVYTETYTDQYGSHSVQRYRATPFPITLKPRLHEVVFHPGEILDKFTLNLNSNSCDTISSGVVESVSFNTNAKFELEESLLIFASQNSENIVCCNQEATLYSLKIFDGSKLLHEYIPCYEKSSNIAGVYDVIDKTFITNASEIGYLLCGPDILPNYAPNIISTERSTDFVTEYAGLPEEYQQIEYLGSTGTQYIKTNYFPNRGTKVVGKFSVPKQSILNSTCLFGERDTYHSITSWELSYDKKERKLISDVGTVEANSIKVANGAVVTFEITTSTSLLNIYSKHSENNFGGQSNYMFYIFASNSHNADILHSNCRLYTFKILEGDNVCADFIPCYRKSDKVGGLYNVIDNTFYEDYAETKLPFDFGPEVNEPVEEDLVTGDLYLYVLDKDFNPIAVLDEYSSLIWSDRYDECGNFELQIPYNKDLMDNVLKQDNYCRIDLSDRCMIIEKIQYDIDENDARTVIVSGRSSESILERRVIWKKKSFGKEASESDDGKEHKEQIQKIMKTLIEENIISPSDEKRQITNFKFKEVSDEKIDDMKIIDTYSGEDILSIVSSICTEKQIGFKVEFTDNNEFIFSIYRGVDRTYDQSDREYVVFSPYYDNLRNSSFFSSAEEFRNFMVIGKGESSYLTVFNENETEPTGIARKEVYVNKNELMKDNQTSINDKSAKRKGKKKLAVDYKVKKGFEGEIVPYMIYSYRKDYFIGDKVQLEDDYGHTFSVYISEVVITKDQNGLTVIPTFKDIEVKWDET